MKQWLARLGFALLVLAFVLAWEGYRASQRPVGDPVRGRATLYFAGAIVLGGMGMAGVRERHRPR